MTLAAYIGGVGLLGPGLADWPSSAAMFASGSNYQPAPSQLPSPTLLPPAERRRTGRVVRLAIAVAAEAAAGAGIEPAALASVFSSSGGDGHNCHELCQALALADRDISPTRFSNSVHNAAAGYWSIATGATRPSTVLCAFDASFGAGLLEAMGQVATEGGPLLLVTYDTEYPPPMHAKRPLPDAFGAALVLTARRSPGSLAHVQLEFGSGRLDTMPDPLLESLRLAVPAARCLPLLRRLACGDPGITVLDYLDGTRLVLRVQPCR